MNDATRAKMLATVAARRAEFNTPERLAAWAKNPASKFGSEYMVGYMTKSLDERIARIKGAYQTYSVEKLKDMLISAQEFLISALSSATGTSDFWKEYGIPKEIKAIRNEIQLRKFKDAAESEDYAYATSGHSVCPDFLNIYRNDPKSPTGVAHVTSVDKTDAYLYAEAQAILLGRTVRLGGQAGA